MKASVLLICLLLSTFIFPQSDTSPKLYPFADEQVPLEKTLPAEHKEVLEQHGDAYSRKQQWHKAAECYKKLVMRYPDVANYHYKYGGALGMLALTDKLKAIGLISKIKKAFKEAAHLDPEHKAVRWALVELYMQLPGILGGSQKKALRYAEELEKLNAVEGYLAKGYSYEHDHELKKAKTYYTMALNNLHTIREFSKNRLHYTIGKLCSDYNTKPDQGLYHLQKYIEHNTSYYEIELPVVYYTMAKLYRQKREKEKALVWIRKALVHNPTLKAAQKEKALIEAL
ncbi:MAG: hypothetical protein AAF934_10090 [Bacteroidota bacterium]